VKKTLSHTARKIGMIFVIVLGIELFFFNFRHWESLGNSEVSDMHLTLGSGYVAHRDGTYTIGEGSLDIDIEGLNCNLKTACIEISVLNGVEGEARSVLVRQYVTDESHKIFYGLPERELWKNEKRSSYITYHLYGKCTGLKIVPELFAGQEISLSIILNPVIPLFLSIERMTAMLLLVAGIALLRPSSVLHRISYFKLGGKLKAAGMLVFFMAHICLFFYLTNVNPYFREERGDNQRQYQELAESLKKGSFFLAEEPPLALTEMENPYDYDYRNQVMNEAGTWYKWDHAYYEGKYYVYFGVIPAVLFYLPYYLITGTHLHNNMLIFVLALLYLAGILGIIDRIIKKWFPQTSLAVWFMMTELTLLGSGAIYMTKRPDLYTVPILSGLVFGVLGLWCFLLADERGKLSLRYLALGALFTALIAGCRPQLFLFVVFSFVLFGKYVISIEMLKKKKTAVLAYVLPMLGVAVLLMYYNYSRFGSVFDFGANYNLTFNDMRRRGWEWDRIPLGIAAYLFWPVRTQVQFPFVEANYFSSQYMGVTIQEATYGGIYSAHLFAWFSLLPVIFHRQMKRGRKQPWLFSVAGLLIAGIVIAADTNMSGILQRYFSDFSIFIMLSAAVAVLLVLSHEEVAGSILERMIIWGLLIALGTEALYQGMIFFLDTGEALKDLRPDLYSHFKYITAFWL